MNSKVYQYLFISVYIILTILNTYFAVKYKKVRNIFSVNVAPKTKSWYYFTSLIIILWVSSILKIFLNVYTFADYHLLMPYEIVNIASLLLILLIPLFFVAHKQLKDNWNPSGLYSHQTLVKNGIYKYIRHPIYLIVIYLCLYMIIIVDNYLVQLFQLAIIIIQFKRLLAEEKVLARTLKGYEDYIKETKLFIPYFF